MVAHYICNGRPHFSLWASVETTAGIEDCFQRGWPGLQPLLLADIGDGFGEFRRLEEGVSHE